MIGMLLWFVVVLAIFSATYLGIDWLLFERSPK